MEASGKPYRKAHGTNLAQIPWWLLIATDPRYRTDTSTHCRCRELDVTCACNFDGPSTAATSSNFVIVIPAGSTGSNLKFVSRSMEWPTPKYRPHRNFYAAPERFESQPLPTRALLRVWLHRKPTRRATAKGVRNWRQQ